MTATESLSPHLFDFDRVPQHWLWQTLQLFTKPETSTDMREQFENAIKLDCDFRENLFDAR